MLTDTCLEYLRRGGRIGAAAAWIGATLKVKPILTIEGTMQPVERVRTAGRAVVRVRAAGGIGRRRCAAGRTRAARLPPAAKRAR